MDLENSESGDMGFRDEPECSGERNNKQINLLPLSSKHCPATAFFRLLKKKKKKQIKVGIYSFVTKWICVPETDYELDSLSEKERERLLDPANGSKATELMELWDPKTFSIKANDLEKALKQVTSRIDKEYEVTIMQGNLERKTSQQNLKFFFFNKPNKQKKKSVLNFFFFFELVENVDEERWRLSSVCWVYLCVEKTNGMRFNVYFDNDTLQMRGQSLALCEHWVTKLGDAKKRHRNALRENLQQLAVFEKQMDTYRVQLQMKRKAEKVEEEEEEAAKKTEHDKEKEAIKENNDKENDNENENDNDNENNKDKDKDKDKENEQTKETDHEKEHDKDKTKTKTKTKTKKSASANEKRLELRAWAIGSDDFVSETSLSQSVTLGEKLPLYVCVYVLEEDDKRDDGQSDKIKRSIQPHLTRTVSFAGFLVFARESVEKNAAVVKKKKEYYFTLEGDVLEYKNTPNDSVSIGMLSLDRIESVYRDNDNNKNEWHVTFVNNAIMKWLFESPFNSSQSSKKWIGVMKRGSKEARAVKWTIIFEYKLVNAFLKGIGNGTIRTDKMEQRLAEQKSKCVKKLMDCFMPEKWDKTEGVKTPIDSEDSVNDDELGFTVKDVNERGNQNCCHCNVM
ncbi:hypothetical protein RFI_15720 [Reticulomyxa filosa]|uniref:PH domain-containing protein n=1 Tax=Reticulomyxa filosa TaxID=46433 RepID=X6N6D6_RETFI|nr:hypothetical protein RFI_15720 [Reticulomyxa filosa]|eukprot:ETO21483.1 hypothetical protein RFI_15720 [Reticulomyxa filosa]